MKILLIISICLLFASGCSMSDKPQTGWGIKGYTQAKEKSYLKVGEISSEWNYYSVDEKTNKLDPMKKESMPVLGVYYINKF